MTHPLVAVAQDLLGDMETFTAGSNERTGSNDGRWQKAAGGAVLISTSRVDLAQHFHRTLTRLHQLAQAHNTGETDWQIPEWLGIQCPGSCAQLGSLWVDIARRDNPDLPVYCTEPGCQDRDGSGTRRSLKWLEAQGTRYVDDHDRPKSILDRLKARVAELERLWADAEDRAEYSRGQREVIQPPDDPMPGDQIIWDAHRRWEAVMLLDPRTGQSVLAFVQQNQQDQRDRSGPPALTQTQAVTA